MKNYQKHIASTWFRLSEICHSRGRIYIYVDNAVLFTKIKNIYTKKACFKEQNNNFHSYWIWIEKYLDVTMKVRMKLTHLLVKVESCDYRTWQKVFSLDNTSFLCSLVTRSPGIKLSDIICLVVGSYGSCVWDPSSRNAQIYSFTINANLHII